MGNKRTTVHSHFITAQGIGLSKPEEVDDKKLRYQVVALAKAVQDLAEIIEHKVLKPED